MRMKILGWVPSFQVLLALFFCGLLVGLWELAHIVSPRPVRLAVLVDKEGDAVAALFESYCHQRRLPYQIERLSYSDLFEADENCILGEPSYDIVMMDDPWVPALIKYNEDGRSGQHGHGLLALKVDQPSDFVGDSLNVAKRVKGYFAVPFVGNAQMLAVQREVTRACDLKTWEGVLECAKATHEQADMYGYVLRGGGRNPFITDFLPILWSYDPRALQDSGELSNGFLSPSSGGAIDMLFQLARTAPPWHMGFGDFDVAAYLARHQAAMGIVWANSALELEKSLAPDCNLEFRPVPCHRQEGSCLAAPGISELGAWLIGVPANAPHATEAAKIVGSMTSTRSLQEALDQFQNPPPRLSAYDHVAPESLKRAMIGALTAARPRYRSNRWEALRDFIGRQMATLYLDYRDYPKMSSSGPKIVQVQRRINDALIGFDLRPSFTPKPLPSGE